MGDEVRLTKGMTQAETAIVTVGMSHLGEATQDLRDVLDILAYKQLQLHLRVYAVSGTFTSCVVSVETSMQNELSEDAHWNSVVSFDAVTTGNVSAFAVTTPIVSTVVQPDRLLRYLRWKVLFSHSSDQTKVSITFEITGVGRPG